MRQFYDEIFRKKKIEELTKKLNDPDLYIDDEQRIIKELNKLLNYKKLVCLHRLDARARLIDYQKSEIIERCILCNKEWRLE